MRPRLPEPEAVRPPRAPQGVAGGGAGGQGDGRGAAARPDTAAGPFGRGAVACFIAAGVLGLRAFAALRTARRPAQAVAVGEALEAEAPTLHQTLQQQAPAAVVAPRLLKVSLTYDF